MLPYFLPVKNLITTEEVRYLENIVDNSKTDFVAYDTVKGKKDGNLCWDNNLEEFNFFNLSSYNFFIKQTANTKVKAHKDNPKWKRNTVLIVPLFWHEDYAPAYFIDNIKVTHKTPILFNTQLEHYVDNNNNDRYNFQICFEESIEEVAECLTRI